MPRPGCAKCKVEYRPEKNDVMVEEMASFGSYRLWRADLWKCPKCGHLLLTGYAREPWMEHFEDGYANELRKNEGKRFVLNEN